MKTVFVGYHVDKYKDPTITIMSSIAVGEKQYDEISFDDVHCELEDASAAARLLVFLESNEFIRIKYLSGDAREFVEKNG